MTDPEVLAPDAASDAASDAEFEPDRASFDLCGPLPTGTTVLEASAGTGKTYTIAALVARFVAEGAARLDQLLMVTFSRSATNELRSRIRERLVGLEHALSDAPSARHDADPVVRLLAEGDTAEVEARRARLAAALTDFDAATIATTHEFCLRMLSGLGVLGEGEPDAVYAEEIDDLVREVATDTYLRMFATVERPPLRLSDALELARAVVGAPHATLVPADTQGSAQDRYLYATAVRAEVTARKYRQRIVTYDDMLTRLRDSLLDPEHGPAAADRLAERYRIVLIDEFQDTDVIQWSIVETAFHQRSTVILIGDPKQAIYAFRGADVYSYLDAVAQAGQVSTLDTNYRSDAALMSALDTLFARSQLGDGIQVRPVQASHDRRRLDDPDHPGLAQPVRLRYLPDDPADPQPRSVGQLRPVLIADLVTDVGRLLGSATTIELDGEPGPRPVQASDIAVLVTANAFGERVRDALTTAGIPAVMTGATSVFATEVADDWLTLLGALEQPNLSAARRIATTRFVGRTLPWLATADDDELTELTVTVRQWSRIVQTYGVAALLEDVGARTGLTARLLGRAGGERELTDLRHVGQALHAAASSAQLGLPGLVQWLTDRQAEARVSGAGGPNDDRSRRLETDAEAVQIMTVWKAKGLEFPIVYLPQAADRWLPDRDYGRPLAFHQPDPAEGPDGGLVSVLDVGGVAPGRNDRLARQRAEDDAESLRLLYVAMTRAQVQVVTWWLPTRYNTAAAPLHRLLFTDRPGGVPAPAYSDTGDPTHVPRLTAELFSLEPVNGPDGLARSTDTAPAPGRAPVPRADPASLSARSFTRTLDQDWRRTSYSALTAAAHGAGGSPAAGVSSESEPLREDDEASASAPVPTVAASSPATDAVPGLDRESPMARLPGGTAFGSLVHAVAEVVDPAAPDHGGDLRAELLAAVSVEVNRLPDLGFTANQLVDGLLPAYTTPLGALAGDRTLADFAVSDRLAELDFELPLSGGDRRLSPTTWAGSGATVAAGSPPVPVLGDLVGLLRRHLGAGDPLAAYADDLADPELAAQTLQGYLTGSIDAVLRVGRGTDPPSFLVVDYKTNRLGPPERPPVLGDYTPATMALAMRGSHYPLQALLYAVALHRYLRWRLPGYRPEVHLGGVLYLFVRGMAGPETPRVTPNDAPCGVFSWRPPAALVTELSDLLDRGPVPAGTAT